MGQESSGNGEFLQKILTKVDKLYGVFFNSPTCTSLKTINASLCSSFIIKLNRLCLRYFILFFDQ